MHFPQRIIWKIYFAIYLLLATLNVRYFFSQEQQQFLYYQVLMAFDIWYLLPYCLNALSIILNVLAAVPLYLFIANRSFLSSKFWGYFFFIRLIMEFFGKSFESKILQALLHESPQTAHIYLGAVTTLCLPSYIALYLYAFHRKQTQ